MAKDRRSRKMFSPMATYGDTTPVSSAVMVPLVRSANSALAIGKHHFTVWLPTSQNSSADLDALIHQTKVTVGPCATNLAVSMLCQGINQDVSIETWVTYNTTPMLVSTQTVASGADSMEAINLQQKAFTFSVDGYQGQELTLEFYEVRTTTSTTFAVKQITCYDLPRPYLETGDAGFVDPNLFRRGEYLTTDKCATLIDGQRTAITGHRSDLINVAGPRPVLILPTITPAGWQNVLDTTHSEWSVDSPGFWVEPSAAWDGDEYLAVRLQLLTGMTASQLEGDHVYVKAVCGCIDGYDDTTDPEIQESDELEITTIGDVEWVESDTLYLPMPPTMDYTLRRRVKVDILAKAIMSGRLELLGDYHDITVGSTSVSPCAQYFGADADVSGWNARGYGPDLALAPSNPPSWDHGPEYRGGYGVQFAGGVGGYYYGTTISPGTDDLVIEVVAALGTMNGYLLDQQAYSTSNLTVSRGATNRLGIFWRDTSYNTVSFSSGTDVDADPHHYLICVNRNEASANGGMIAIDGVAVATQDCSAATAAIISTGQLDLGHVITSNIYYVAVWHAPSLFSAGATGMAEMEALAATRHNLVVGVP